MKFYCDNCHAKYAIADEKVRGKILKVRCKKCSHVITVREPRAPAGAASKPQAPRPPAAPAQIEWHYAINGQSFGPFKEADLAAMFASGELDDACYLWHDGFPSWKPAREVPEFVSALNRGAQLRPRNKTIGVSGALEAISVDARRPEADSEQEEEGVVPGASPAEDSARAGDPPHNPFADNEGTDVDDGLSERLEGLRDKLRQNQAPTPEARQNPFDRRPVEERSPEDEPTPDEPEGAPDQDAAPDGEPEDDAGFTLPPSPRTSRPEEPAPVEDEGDDLLPSFGGLATSDESVIDFSRLEKKKSDDDSFVEAPFVVDDKDRKNGDDDQFAVSNSLLIQMSSIQKQGRGKRYILIAALAILVVGIGAVAAITAQNRSNKPKLSDDDYLEDDQKRELVFKKYSEDELSFELSDVEEVITSEDTLEAMEELGDKNEKARAAKKRAVVAKNSNPTTKPKIEDSGPKVRGLDASGLGDLVGKESKLGSALEGSKAGNTGASASLKTRIDAGAKISSDGPNVRTGGGPRNNKFDSATSTRRTGGLSALDKIRRNNESNAGKKKKSGPSLGDKGVLSKDAAKAGFKKIRRSVAYCHQRQVSRGLPLSSAKVHVTVEIKGSGEVSAVKLSPASFKHTEFESCMQEHRRRGRWRFDAYGGKTIKIKNTYVLQ